ncbi:Glutathione S-transferase [Mycena sanguinolenta]|uniref:Glutathione S-transferase n=1 Tax=Mycena sanguinolenta TaxID=230812 RepID=A0A8H6WY73_9AGAR|nr:Glutathione S-transferase [Mycena sanguinolenta]
MPTLTVHHLNISQSERIPWLCEELAIPYELKTYKRAPIFAPPELKALHPSGAAPIIQDGDLTLAESGACIEYIAHRHAGGALFLPPTHPAYAQFMLAGANGTFQALFINHSVAKERLGNALGMLDARLEENDWLAGEEFTVADIMLVFSLTTMRYFYVYSLGEHRNVVRYLQRVGAREGYQRAMKKCDPEMELVLGADPPAKPFGNPYSSQ